MATNLYTASRQWSERPADERFSSLDEMLTATRGYRERSREAEVAYGQLTVAASGDEVMLSGPNGGQARLCHWSFGQLARRVGAPAEYLRSLPAGVAADALSHGLSKMDGESSSERASLLFHNNGSLVARAMLPPKYQRVWNSEVVDRLCGLQELGWRVPPARPAFHGQPGSRLATEADVLNQGALGGLTVKVGDLIAPAGLYASDHDMFAFLVNDRVRIQDGSEDGLARGVFAYNSEVGGGSLKLTKFLYRGVCGNHIVWDCQQVEEIRMPHIGSIRDKWSIEVRRELSDYVNASTDDDHDRIRLAQRYEIAGTKDEVLNILFGKRIASRKNLLAAYEAATEQADTTTAGSPRTAWGFAQGLTHLSQRSPFADERNELDRAAGKVLSIAF